MSAHATPAETLLAMLADETGLESLPVDAVRLDLVRLGIDPSRSIALARKLASSPPSPGAELLGALGEADEAEREIARIETADIDEVRSRIPQGTAASIAAEARRRAGAGANVVGLPRKSPRRTTLRWAGSLAAIAASFLLIVIVGREFLVFNKTQEPQYENYALNQAPAKEPAPTISRQDSDDEPQDAGQRSFGQEMDGRDKAYKPVAPKELEEQVVTERARKQARSESSDVAAAPMADAFEPEQEARALSGEVSVPDTNVALLEKQEESLARDAVASANAPGGEFKRDGQGLLGFAGGPISAVLIIEPDLAPASLTSQALPPADLAARLDEARELAGDRKVIALVRVANPEGHRDFIQLPLLPRMTQQMPPPGPLGGLLGEDAVNYDFIELPAE